MHVHECAVLTSRCRTVCTLAHTWPSLTSTPPEQLGSSFLPRTCTATVLVEDVLLGDLVEGVLFLLELLVQLLGEGRISLREEGAGL